MLVLYHGKFQLLDLGLGEDALSLCTKYLFTVLMKKNRFKAFA